MLIIFGKQTALYSQRDPWDWYIYIFTHYIYHKIQPNVGKQYVNNGKYTVIYHTYNGKYTVIYHTYPYINDPSWVGDIKFTNKFGRFSWASIENGNDQSWDSTISKKPNRF